MSSAAATAETSPGLHRQVKVSHILLSTASALQEVTEQLAGGAEFAVVAKERSQCGSARRGGELGWLPKGAYLPEFEAAAFSAPVGTVTTAATDKGHHAILVMSEKYEAAIQQMTVEELAQVLGDIALAEDVQFVDVREPSEWDTARLPRFQLMPLSTFQEWGPKVVGRKLLDRSKETVVLCHHGVRSMQMAQFLVSNGFTDVKNVVGGIHAFSEMDSRVPMY